MKIAVPVANGMLCMHFGHAPEFVVLTVDDSTKIITSSETLVAPEHEPGLLPKWLGEKGRQCDHRRRNGVARPGAFQ